MTQVLVKKGEYRNTAIRNRQFRLTQDYRVGKKGGFITVIGDEASGFPGKEIRIKVSTMKDFEVTNSSSNIADLNDAELSELKSDDSVLSIVRPDEVETTETDEEAIARIRERFEILDDMTQAAVDGTVRAMIVSGPPGVGKSFGVEAVLERASLFDKIGGKRQRFEVVKGAMSAIGLYCKLFSYADAGSVLVFDDCDSILLDDLSLNILKAALDSSKKRTISWNTDSSMLRREGVPDRFEFKGSVIFITNIKFEHVRSKKLKDHLDALESRCHYLDLTMDGTRDKILRIKQIVADGMLDDYDFDDAAKDEVVNFVAERKDQLRELSLRTVLKVADLRKMSPTSWKKLAETTVIRRA